MTPAAADYVVDASIGIKLFLVAALSDEAHAFFRRLTDDPPSRALAGSPHDVRWLGDLSHSGLERQR
jgi:hypothetical protein